MQFANICPCAEVEWLPRLVRRKVAIHCAFAVGFQKVLRVVFYFLWLCPVQLALLCRVASLKVPAMIFYDVATKVLDTEIFSQYNITGLMISGITFMVWFRQGKPLRWKEISTHARTHAHTHECNNWYKLWKSTKPGILLIL